VKALVFALLTTLLAAPALAKTHSIPADNPIVTIVVPDKGWSASEIDNGIEVSDDDEVYVAIQGVDGNDAAERVASAISYLKREGVTVDPASKTEKEGKLGAFDVFDLGWKGKDKDGEVLVHLTIINVTPQRGVLFTYWATPKGDKQHDAALGAMPQSIKKVGN
jgi:hypothetical protein